MNSTKKIIFPNWFMYILMFVSPLTDVFIIKKLPIGIISAFLLITIIASIILIVTFGKKKIIIHDLVYYLLIILLVCSCIITYFLCEKNNKSEIYLLGYVFVFIFYGIITKIVTDNTNWNNISKEFILNILFFYSIISIYDWTAQNKILYVPRIADIIPRIDPFFNSEALGYIRLRGTIEEGAHYALFINLFFPLSIVLSSKRGILFIFKILIISVSYILAVSLLGFFCLIFAAFLGYALYINRKRIYILLTMLTIPVVCILLFFAGPLNNELTRRIFNPEEVSRVERINSYINACSDIMEYSPIEILFGCGIANFNDKYNTNPLSMYLLFLHDTGFFSLVLLLLIFLYVLIITNIKNTNKTFNLSLTVSLLCGFLQYFFSCNFWHPWLWILFSIALVLKKQNLSKSFH